jgi:hypothetical protein
VEEAAVTWTAALTPRLEAAGEGAGLGIPAGQLTVGDRPCRLMMTLPRRALAGQERAYLHLARGAEALLFVDGKLLAGLDRHHGRWPIDGLNGQTVEVVYDHGPTRRTTAVVRDWRTVVVDAETSALGLDMEALLSLATALGEATEVGLHVLRLGDRAISAMDRLASPEALRQLPEGHALLLYGRLAPVRVRLRTWFTDRRLRRLARG